MRLIEVIPLSKIPMALPQVLSYFTNHDLRSGALVLAPLGKRQQEAIVVETHEINDFKMEIKKAGYELRPIKQILSGGSVLTSQQIELALWLGQYYFCSPGLFLKMMVPKQKNPKLQIPNPKQILNFKFQKLILAPTIPAAEKITSSEKSAAIWHSDLTKKQQNEIWWKIKNREIETIVGTRSAIFLPFANLKEITIEDETNSAHRSWDMFPHYRAPEAAQKLAEIFDAKLFFKSPIPSIEFSDVAHRNSDVAHRKISLIDMRAELREGNFSIFSRALQTATKEALAQKRQIIFYVNRRGAANFVLCRDCGYINKCQNCEAPLAYHLTGGKPLMFCHRCGHRESPPSLCPKCQSYRIKTVGVGTQKVEVEARKIFTSAKIIRLDSDTAPRPKDQQKIIETIIKKEVDILVTTQIIFSWQEELKQSPLAVIAVISADTLLHLPDYQSGERTYQTIAALKNLLPSAASSLIIQTHNPENLVIKYAAKNDWNSFYKNEIETRQVLGYPPFSQIVKLTFRHKDPQKAGQEAKILAAKLKRTNSILCHSGKSRNPESGSRVKHGMTNGNIEISDALPAFIPREKGKFIWNIIIKFPIPDGQTKMSNEFLRRRNSLLQYIPSNWEIDVDPSDLL